MQTDEPSLARASAFVAQSMGIHFPQERWPDLLRGIGAAKGDLGFGDDAAGCLRWLAGAPLLSKSQFESLAAHLTVGETYFFREPRHFDFFATRILPELLGRDGERRIRIWSAGCCTGEEAYSIAILLRRLIPDLDRWQVTLLATDINPRFLKKGQAGVFGPWSFRDAPAWLKPHYFRARPDGHFEVLPEIRRMVRFAPLNLAEDAYPSILNETHAMDVVFCRNVLMYFSATQARNVIQKLYRAQREGGWLIVASSELPNLSVAPYETVRAPDVQVFRKCSGHPVTRASAVDNAPEATTTAIEPLVMMPMPAIPPRVDTEPPPSEPRERAAALYAAGHYDHAADLLSSWLSTRTPTSDDAAAMRLLARCLANQGQLGNALHWCDRSITADKCDAASQYLRALILQEQGSIEEAVRSLRSALFLDPHFVLAHVALGTAAREQGNTAAAQKHFQHAMELLRDLPPEKVLSDADQMTAGQLWHTIETSMPAEVSR